MSGPVQLPVDRLGEVWPDFGKTVRVGALLHGASVTSSLCPVLEVLESMKGIELSALFGPQHGFAATTQDNMVEWSGFTHPRLGV
ncbi:MAG: DUF1343 domain-containing protein, partial [Akkermansiaceae bacterium]|nr:DUF1343 domain-containing protein [Akkermansiaceae bacterium]